MTTLKQTFAQRSIPGPPCSLGLLLQNVTPEDRHSLTEAIELIKQSRLTNPTQSKLSPNAAWLTRLIRKHIGINMPSQTVQRHLRGDCRCARETQ
jgi:hypothetical protein